MLRNYGKFIIINFFLSFWLEYIKHSLEEAEIEKKKTQNHFVSFGKVRNIAWAGKKMWKSLFVFIFYDLSDEIKKTIYYVRFFLLCSAAERKKNEEELKKKNCIKTEMKQLCWMICIL